MYATAVLLLMVLLPAGSVAAEHGLWHGAMPLTLLVGKWFVFWSAGVRLTLAGLRQLIQPRFTAEHIFGMRSDDAIPFVRELGVANLAMGVVGMVSLADPSFVLPVALAGAIFYGIAGIRHATDHHRNASQNLAMVTDLWASLIFLAYIGWRVLR
jgi:hypothetical protein